MEKTRVSIGEHFTFKNYTWVVLGEMEGDILCVMSHIWRPMEFSKDCR